MPLRRIALLAPIVLSCRAADVPPAPAGPVAPVAPPVDAGASPPEAGPAIPAGPRVEVLPDKPALAEAKLELSWPRPAEGLSREAALALPVRVVTRGVPDGIGARVVVVLDGDGAVLLAAADAARPIGAILPADQVLGDGTHRIDAFLLHADGDLARGPRGVVSASATFSVGAARPEPGAPRVVLVWPRGTYNGPEAADAALLAFVVRPPVAGASVAVQVTGVGTRTERTVTADHVYRLEGLVSGDYDVSLSLAGGESAAPATRTITVNRDAPLPK